MKTLIAWSIVLLLGSAVPGLAQQTGKDAFDTWIDGIEIDGLKIGYGSAVEEGGTLTIKDLSVSYNSSFEIEPEGEQAVEISVSVDMKAPEIVGSNLSYQSGALAADRFDFTDVLQQDGVVLIDGEPLLEFTSGVHNYRLAGMVWPQFPKPPAALKGSVRGWIDWYAMLLDFRLDEATGDMVTAEISLTEEVGVEEAFTTTIEYKDFRLEGMRDGRIDLYSFGQTVQETSYMLEGAPYVETATMESTVARDLDSSALFELFNPRPAGTSERVQMIGSVESVGYRTESDLYEFLIERIAYGNIAIQAPETDFVALIEQLLDDVEPDAPTIVTAVIDLYRSFSIGTAVMEGFQLDVAVEGENASAKIDRFAMNNLSSDGLEEMVLEGLDLDARQNGRFTLDRFGISEVEFPPYGPIKAFAADESAWDNPDPLETTRIFFPLSFVTDMKGLFAASPELPGDVKLDGYLIEMRTQVPPIPTHFVFTVEGLEFPVSLIEEPEARAMFEAAGIDVLRLSEEIRVSWNEATEELVVENITIDLGQVGRVSARATLGGVPRTVMENPQQAQALMFTLNLKSVDLELLNEGGVQTALALYAQMVGSGEDALKEQLLLQLSAMLGQVGNDVFSDQVMTAARRFFDDPQNLSIRLAPSAPVPVTQIMSDAMAAPDALPERLGITVEANR